MRPLLGNYAVNISMATDTDAAIGGMVFSMGSELEKPVSQSWQLAGMQTVRL